MKEVIFIHVLYLLLIRTFMVKGNTKCESKVELRAVLLSCPVRESGCDDDDPISQVMNSEEAQILQASGRDFESFKREKEKGFPKNVKDCKRKLIITLKIKNVGKIPCDDEYIIIDHVFDPVSGGKGRLLSPVVLKIRQEQMIELYGLRFKKVVNSDPFEEQKNIEKACSVNMKNPTCGVTTYNGKPIPFSEGFCCSSDEPESAESQLSPTLPKDSIQIDSQKGGRFTRAENSHNTIYNPHLVELLANEDSSSSVLESEKADKKGSNDCLKAFSLDKLPNYLFERDRKIVCIKKDFLSELSEIQKELRQGFELRESLQSPDSENSLIEKGSFGIDSKNDDLKVKTKSVKSQESDRPYEESVQNILPVKINRNEINLNEDEASNKIMLLGQNNDYSTHATLLNKRVPAFDEMTKLDEIIRGKRENGKEPFREEKELSLEEKLENFSRQKNHFKNRRKRLFGLSHKKFEKEIHCRNAEDCRPSIATEYPAISPDCGKSLLPRYFFIHDKTIVKPQEGNMSGPCKNPCEMDFNKCAQGQPKMETPAPAMAPMTPMTPHQDANARRSHCQKSKPTCGRKMYPTKQHKPKCGCKIRKEKILHRNKCGKPKCEPKIPHGCRTQQHKCITGEKQTENGNYLTQSQAQPQQKQPDTFMKTDTQKNEKQKEIENLQQKAELYQKRLLASILEDKKIEKEKLRNFLINKNYERPKSNVESFETSRNSEQGGEKNPKEEMNHLKMNIHPDFQDVLYKLKQMGEEKKNEENQVAGSNSPIQIYTIKEEGSGGPWLKVPESPVKIFDPLMKNADFQIQVANPGIVTSDLSVSKKNYDKPSQNWNDVSMDKNIPSERKLSKSLQKDGHRWPHPQMSHEWSEPRDINLNIEVIRKNYPKTLSSDLDTSRTDISQKMQANTKTKVYNFADDKNFKLGFSKSRNIPIQYYKTPQKYYLLKNGKYKPLQDIADRGDDPRQFFTIQQDRLQLFPSKTNSRQRQSYETSHSYKKPLQHHYMTPSDSSLKKIRQSHLVTQGSNPFYITRFQRKGYPEVFFRNSEDIKSDLNFYDKGNDDISDSSRGKVRSRRSVEDSFELAQGFFTSELEELSDKGKETDIIHALDTCPPLRKTRTLEASESLEVSKEQANGVAYNSEVVSSFEESQDEINHPFAGFVQPEDGILDTERQIAKDRKRLIQSYLNAPDYVLEEIKAQTDDRLQNRERRKRDEDQNNKNDHSVLDKVYTCTEKPTQDDKKDSQSSNKVFQDAKCPDTGKGCQDEKKNSQTVNKGCPNASKESSRMEKEPKADKGCPVKSCQNTNKGDSITESPKQDKQNTAHCMRFGDMWYSLYAIKRPIIAQTIGIQLFDKQTLCDGTTEWRDLTKGKMVRVGTFLPKAEDDMPSISVAFTGGKTKKPEHAIDYENYMVLIPSHVSDPNKAGGYPQLNGGPEEYLLVPSKEISDGKECNMIGTSFEAFALQQDRCLQKKGSCLKRQPIDLWREDMEARIRGKRGKYFVENFGTIPDSPVKTYTNFSGDFLALEYHGEYTSTLEIEVKADSNAIIRKGSVAQIPSVYIDSTYPRKTRIILSVLNIGLSSSYFRPRLGDCPPDLNPAWCPLEGPLVTIPPHQRHDFKLDLSGMLPPSKISLSVQVLNQMNKKIAYRKIIIKKAERCICAFHCKCNCFGSYRSGRACHTLSVDDYRAAGYIGPFPYRGGVNYSSPPLLKHLYIIVLTATYFLLLLGFLKAVLGIFCRRLGIAGVRIITGPRQLTHYYETELQFCTVLYNDCGFPIHPTTCLPVQIVPLCGEIIINILFFFLYPIRGTYFICASLSRNKFICTGCENCCPPNDTFFYEHSSSSPLLTKSQPHTCMNYNLTTFNTKQGKAEEFLPYLPYDGDDDPLEEDDTEFVLQEMKRYRKK